VPKGSPEGLDAGEPGRVAAAVAALGLKYAVVTSVTRDDLQDGGAAIFAETIRAIRKRSPGCKVEVLVPDFQGSEEALGAVLDASPDVLNHNVETVPALYGTVRPQADYERSLKVLERAKARGSVTKSGLMLGLGEGTDDVLSVIHDLRGVGCDILTLGQYLQPRRDLLPVARFWRPDEFKELQEKGMVMGFARVIAGPLVRSSYQAGEHGISIQRREGRF
jgi:lipoic acid synthetase